MTGTGKFLRQAHIMAGKDLKIFLLDPGSVAFALLFPFVFVVIFSLVLAGSFTTEDKPLEICVATAEPKGSLSDEIITGMAAGKELWVRRLQPAEANRLLADGKIAGYLSFPTRFSEALLSGRPSTLTVYSAPEAATTRAALTSVAHAIAADTKIYQVMYRAIAELAGGSAGTRAGSAGPGDGSAGPALGPPSGAFPGHSPADAGPGVNLVFEQVGEIEPVRPVDYLVPANLVMFVFFALAFTAEGLLGERENYTLERLVAASATRASIVAGKMAGAFLRGMVQVAVFWTAGILVFHIRMGHYPGTVVLVSVLLTAVSAATGVFLATVAKTRKGAVSMAVFVSLSAAALGGCWWPLFIMPGWLQNLARVTPHAWANLALNKLMLFGAAPVDVWPEMAALAAFALVFGGLAVWRFRIN